MSTTTQTSATTDVKKNPWQKKCIAKKPSQYACMRSLQEARRGIKKNIVILNRMNWFFNAKTKDALKELREITDKNGNQPYKDVYINIENETIDSATEYIDHVCETIVTELETAESNEKESDNFKPDSCPIKKITELKPSEVYLMNYEQLALKVINDLELKENEDQAENDKIINEFLDNQIKGDQVINEFLNVRLFDGNVDVPEDIELPKYTFEQFTKDIEKYYASKPTMLKNNKSRSRKVTTTDHHITDIEYSLKKGLESFKEDMKSAYTHEHLAKDIICLISKIYDECEHSFPYLKNNPEIYKELNEYKNYLYQKGQDYYQEQAKNTYIIPYDKLVDIKNKSNDILIHLIIEYCMRDDWNNVQIYQNIEEVGKDEEHKNKNYYVRDIGKLVFNKTKTSDKYDFEFIVNEHLKNMIDDDLQSDPRTYLFSNKDDPHKPCAKMSGNRINNLFHKYGLEGKVGFNTIRKSIETYYKDADFDTRYKIAKQLGHTVSIAKSFYTCENTDEGIGGK
jgi:hypothetical protein